jgi:hypothetical protein
MTRHLEGFGKPYLKRIALTMALFAWFHASLMKQKPEPARLLELNLSLKERGDTEEKEKG